jgi:hypothetical protein
MNLNQLRDWLDSPEGQESIIKFGEKLKKEEETKKRYVQYIHDKFSENIGDIIQKLVDKYDSNEYVNREYKLGYQPRESLLWVMLTYAKEYGTEFTKLEYDKYANMFTGEMFYLGDWVFEVMHGQGSVINVYKKEYLKEQKYE